MVEHNNLACLRWHQSPPATQPDVTGSLSRVNASPSGLNPSEALSASGLFSLRIDAQPVLTVLLSALGYGMIRKLLMMATAS